MAQSEDGTSILITHQNDTETSLFSTGLPPPTTSKPSKCPASYRVGNSHPALEFVAQGVTVGGNGIALIPHDPDAFPDCASEPRPAYLQTSRFAPRLDRIRYYADDGEIITDAGVDAGVDANAGPVADGGAGTDAGPVADGGAGTDAGGTSSNVVMQPIPSSNYRPYISDESIFPILSNASGVDSRGIAMDDSARIACKALPGADLQECARLPARVYIGNRSPASLLVGTVGATTTPGTYDPDFIFIYNNVPLVTGVSRVYLAPIVDRAGNYAMRLFVVCFDSAQIFVYDPATESIENIIKVGTGPYAMAFDPFTAEAVALHQAVPIDDRQAALPMPSPPSPPGTTAKQIRTYSFAYLASFTNSFVQVIDLDNSRPASTNATFETVVYTLGNPTPPKGNQ